MAKLDLTPDDRIHIAELHDGKGRYVIVAALIFGIVVLSWSIANGIRMNPLENDDPIFAVLGIAPLVIVVGVLIWIAWRIWHLLYGWRRQYAKAEWPDENLTLTVTEDGAIWSNEQMSHIIRWGHVHRVRRGHGLVLLYETDQEYSVIPLRCLDEDEKATVENALARIDSVR